MQRMDISQVAPDLYKALLGVETYLRGSVEPATYELVKLRASITNGCLFCVDMHTNDAMKAGETTQRLFGVAAWREAPWYTDAERAALALTDAAPTPRPDGVPDAVWPEAAAHLAEKAPTHWAGAARQK